MKKDDATWLRICYICFGVIIAYTVMKAMNTVGIQTGWSEKYFEWFPIAAAAISVLAGIGSFWGIGKDSERHGYFLASIGELRKVSWPTAIDTRRMTIIVCVVVGVFAVILALFDIVWSKLLGILLS